MASPNYEKRIKTFQKSMKCNYAVLVSRDYDSNVYYFTGFKGGNFGFLVIPKKGKASFISSSIDIGNAQNKSIKKIIIKKSTREELRKIIKKNKIIGVDFSALALAYYAGLKKSIKPKKVVDVSQILLEQRAVKDKYELVQIKNAAKNISEILDMAIKNIPTFNYEREIKNFIDVEARKRGLPMSFDTIVASGKNASNPHYSRCSDRLRRGFLVIDCGVKFNGYCSDITRTVFLGNPTRQEIQIYNKVLNIQKKCIGMLSSKTPKQVNEFAKRELGKDFLHSLGHGIGLDIHELPNITLKNNSKLKNSTCFTVEPGVYKKGKYGIRLEDDLLKQDWGLKILTSVKNSLTIINKKVYK
ncbi:aminopeptidase P family protein [Candidatus Woesearchaeota archaeon]|nr:aminopeptidase P family protein [Candidatus Woesearchaeota archaeon]